MQMLGNNKTHLTARYENLIIEHRQLDAEVKAINSKSYLNSEQQLQLNHLKKMKLLKKDEIEQLRVKIS